jgi:hypothetical protein
MVIAAENVQRSTRLRKASARQALNSETFASRLSNNQFRRSKLALVEKPRAIRYARV